MSTSTPAPASAPVGGAAPAPPDTIVLVHGLWLTPESWQPWIERFEARGFRVLAPLWPGEPAGIAALRADPSGMNGIGIGEIADHLESFVRALDAPPILIGHSFGGLMVQLLLDRGVGAVGVALHPAPVKGVLGLPIAQLRSALPVLRNPANRKRTVALTFEQFHWGFANALDEAAARDAYARLHVPGPGRPLFQGATANFARHAPSAVDFGNPRRAPLLLVAGDLDRTVPASTVREAAKRWRKSPSTTELREYAGRSHFTAGEPGWERVADESLAWALTHAQGRAA
jgi:alpha-beta hydrolase superfamily lysophospholipase